MHLSGAPVAARRFRPIAGDFAGSRTSSTILLCEQYSEYTPFCSLRTHENNSGSDLLVWNMPVYFMEMRDDVKIRKEVISPSKAPLTSTIDNFVQLFCSPLTSLMLNTSAEYSDIYKLRLES
jgi:hypothetical protein